MASMLNEIDRNEADLAHVPTVEQAERDLQDHLATYPGDYFTCYRENRLGIRRDWLIRRDSLQGALRVARMVRDLNGDRCQSVAAVAKAPKHRPKAAFRKTANQYAEKYEDILRKLKSYALGSPEWIALRHEAQMIAHRARARAIEDRMGMPALSEIPDFCREPYQ